MSYEVRVIDAKRLHILFLPEIGPPLSAFCMLSDDEESVVAKCGAMAMQSPQSNARLGGI